MRTSYLVLAHIICKACHTRNPCNGTSSSDAFHVTRTEAAGQSWKNPQASGPLNTPLWMYAFSPTLLPLGALGSHAPADVVSVVVAVSPRTTHMHAISGEHST